MLELLEIRSNARTTSALPRLLSHPLLWQRLKHEHLEITEKQLKPHSLLLALGCTMQKFSYLDFINIKLDFININTLNASFQIGTDP